jgi:hypothetical protein
MKSLVKRVLPDAAWQVLRSLKELTIKNARRLFLKRSTVKNTRRLFESLGYKPFPDVGLLLASAYGIQTRNEFIALV